MAFRYRFFCFLLLAPGIVCQLAEPEHFGKRWNEIDDPRWDIPNGQIYETSSPALIRALQDTLQPGDVIVLRNGEYAAFNMEFTASGASGAGNKVYFVAETFGGVRLTGRSNINLVGDHIEVRGLWFDGTSDEGHRSFIIQTERGSLYNRVTNSAITWFNENPLDFSRRLHWVELWGYHHTVDHCSFVGKQALGQILRVMTDTDQGIFPPWRTPDSAGHLIEYNYFGPRNDTEMDDGEAIQIGLEESEWLNTNTTVKFNYFYRYSGEIESISVKASNNDIQFNTFRESRSLVTLRHGHYNLVEYNYFYCGFVRGCGGVRVMGSHHVVHNNYIENAVIQGTLRGGINMLAAHGDGGFTLPASDTVVSNNVMYHCDCCIKIGNYGRPDAPHDNLYYENVLYADSVNSYCIQERSAELNSDFNSVVIYRGRSDVHDGGIIRHNPEFVYDAEWQIYRPTDAGFVFDMVHKSVGEEATGATWLSK